MIRKLAQWLVVLTLCPPAVARGQDTPLARKVHTSDSTGIMTPTISPDEKWLLWAEAKSNQESQLMIRPLAGGEPRVLPVGKAWYVAPKFTPQGDRILVFSNLVRRDPSDDGHYLLSAPFDTKTGTLTGPLRQVTLDAIRIGAGIGPYSISPDGRHVVYLVSNSNAVRIVPAAGGSARTLADPTSRPSMLAWSADGQAVFYNLAKGDSVARMQVGLDGSAPKVVGTSNLPLGMLAPDNRHSFAAARSGRNWILRVFAPDGRLQGEVPIPGWAFDPVAGGKYLIGRSVDAVAPIKVVPVAGGPIKQVTEAAGYDWPVGWSPDGGTLWIAPGANGTGPDSSDNRWVAVTPDGKVKNRMRLPAGTGAVAENDEYFVYDTHPPLWPDRRLIRVSLKDGSTRELTGPVLPSCLPVAAGGMYYGAAGEEFYYGQAAGNRVQVRAMTFAGVSRLLAELPAGHCQGPSVFRDRLAYVAVEDSARLRITAGPGTSPRTLATFRPSQRFSNVAWSRDGSQLAVGLDESPQRLFIYRFDAAGRPQGSPRVLTLPFEYWYEEFWLPDGSGFTMIAQPRGMPMTHVVVVKLADPDHPVLLTREDPNNKWGHALSPDGKYVAYPSEQRGGGSSIYLIDVAGVLKRVGATK